jgi:hypothetical protein
MLLFLRIYDMDKGLVRSYKLSNNLREAEKLMEDEIAAGEAVLRKKLRNWRILSI